MRCSLKSTSPAFLFLLFYAALGIKSMGPVIFQTINSLK
jgi:hypothetical protein